MPADRDTLRAVADAARKLDGALAGDTGPFTRKTKAARTELRRALAALDREPDRENLISRRAVMSAVYHLRSQEGPRSTWPTAERIAEYLQTEVADVLDHLRALKKARMFRDRQRKGQRVWMPWEES